ncbi:Por secretion system C-terminal sorting domain-containing protein [Catalinimonas alkaloidigena]|uniref:Por secretion system C-terminal sorting domain-containing protein n=1 Tax=Catalinimonas alkaloidigena TaxID=1075417 RepID=A0A1G9SJZ5_9BACT|nr:lipocalin-like domain-containing protein [Catalinimonas alkaloidigena]SDM35620.1 Por secretion system C-terminal sorting domain-containing protein [Catalinimonas alkaloidigena]
MKLPFLVFTFLLTLLVGPVAGQAWKTYPYAPENSRISFPQDEGAHLDEPIEWWYTMGHLVGDSSGTRYSFMLTYFDYEVYGFDGFRILNLSNDDAGEFYQETLPINFTELAEDSLYIKAAVFSGKTETWTHKTAADGRMIPFEYVLKAYSKKGALDLAFVAEKPPLILADSGFFHQGAASYTYYYSQTTNRVTGTLTINGVQETVTGTSWIDRQYGSFDPNKGENYEWFSVQLSNGMDLNIFNIFTKENTTPDTLTYKTLAAYVDTAHQYTTADYQLERLAFAYTPDSTRCYSQRWRLTSPVNQVDLLIEAEHPNSEVALPFRFYEGATRVSGTVNGVAVTGYGFAELLHSYARPDITLLDPQPATWGPEVPMTWQLHNPDDGRAVWYDLDYSVEGKQFLPVATALTDTFYYWQDMPALAADSLWIRVTAYSVDSTLTGSSTLGAEVIATQIAVQPLRASGMVYPNPTSDFLLISLDTPVEPNALLVTDVQGRAVATKVVREDNALKVDVTRLMPGVYRAQVTLPGRVHTFRFLVN